MFIELIQIKERVVPRQLLTYVKAECLVALTLPDTTTREPR
jgi:hypothetical protein